VTDTATYRLVHEAPAIPGGKLSVLMRLCEPCFAKRLSTGWANLGGRRRDFPPGACDDCTVNERKASLR
jgi:hypothetical protein